MSPATRTVSLKRAFADLSNEEEQRRVKVGRINSAFVKTPNTTATRGGDVGASSTLQAGAPKKFPNKPSDDNTSPVQYNNTLSSDSPASSSNRQDIDDDNSLISNESIIDLSDDYYIPPRVYPTLKIFSQLASGSAEMARQVWDNLSARERMYCMVEAPPLPTSFGGKSTYSIGKQFGSAKEISLAEGWKRQHALNTHMRAKLIDWIIDISEEYELQRVSVHAAINYIDRYISIVRGVTKSYLQLLGITALFIASKIEEWEAPRAIDFVCQTDGAVNSEDMMAFEQVLIRTLDFRLHPITTPMWVATYLQIVAIECGAVDGEDMSKPLCAMMEHHYSVAMGLCDLAALHPGTLKFLYSEVAGAAVLLTLPPKYNAVRKAVTITGKVLEALQPCMDHLQRMAEFASRPKQRNVHLQPYMEELQRLEMATGN